MSKDPTVFLKHILESIEHIETYVKDLSEKDFINSDEKTRFCNQKTGNIR